MLRHQRALVRATLLVASLTAQDRSVSAWPMASSDSSSSRSASAGVGGHIRWMTFYGLNASEQHSWVNLATGVATGSSGGRPNSVIDPSGPLLRAWQAYRLPGMLDLEDVGGGFADGLYIRRGFNDSHVNPNWKALLTKLLDSAMPFLESTVVEWGEPSGGPPAIKGIFLGDEPCCNGVPVAEVAAVADFVKARVNHTPAFLYLNECQRTFVGDDGPGTPALPAGSVMKTVPRSIDYISADIYNAPGKGAARTRKAYESLLYPAMAPSQRVFLVPGLFGDTTTPRAQMDQILLDKLSSFWSWALDDERVAGLNPWHYTTEASLHNPYTLGAREFPRLRQELETIGKLIRRASGDDPLPVEPLGVYCQGYDCAETTPVLWPPGEGGSLVMVEHHSNFRVRHQKLKGVGSNSIICPSIPGSEGVSYASAIVVGNALWVFGTNDGFTNMSGSIGRPRTQVHVFSSTDPLLSAASWRHAVALQLPQNGTDPVCPFPPAGCKSPCPSTPSCQWFTGYNTSPARGVLDGKDAFVLAIELGSPGTAPGWAVPTNTLGFHPYFTVFAVCRACAETEDLSHGWELLEPERFMYKRDRLSADPTLRFFSPWWYVVVAFEGVEHPAGKNCHSNSTHFVRGCITQNIARSRDLEHWEESASSVPFLGFPDGEDLSGPDHKLMAGGLLEEEGTAEEKEWVRTQTDDVNRSDMDMVTLPNGQTFFVHWTGNQGRATPPNNVHMSFQAAGLVNGTEQEWLESYFPRIV